MCEKDELEFFSDKSKKDGLSSLCKICKTASAKAWVSRNPEKVKAYKAAYASVAENRAAKNARAKEYRAENADAIREYHRNRWASQKDRVYEINRRWWVDNPAKTSGYKQKRRAANAKAYFSPTECDEFLLTEVYALRDMRTASTGIKWEVDHVIPLVSGEVCGLHTWWNLRVIPMRENRVKSNKFSQEDALAFSGNSGRFAATLAPR